MSERLTENDPVWRANRAAFRLFCEMSDEVERLRAAIGRHKKEFPGDFNIDILKINKELWEALKCD